MTEIRLDAMLREFSAPTRTETTARDVDALLTDLETRFPRLRLRLRDEAGQLRRFVRVFVNGQPIDELQGFATRLDAHDQVEILHSIQGG
ncbi:MAG TPA: MoaD/ThiS family protein [Thermoplasmata archaeon]|nr:MoaD/ThiS family protein [Thermoplasmata archaeon]